MITNPANEGASGFADLLAVRSDRLKDLRMIIEGMEGLDGMLGVAANFSIVVDTNVVLRDILWLVAKRRDPSAKTALMETIEAGTVKVYAPYKLQEEMEEKIPLIAADKGLDEQIMYAEWQVYKEILEIIDPEEDKVEAFKQGVDPDDADFIALAQTISAAGVLSEDKHIEMMGGNTISIECIAHLRNYSRAAAVEFNIKVNGFTFTLVGVAAVRALIQAGRALIRRIGAAPDWIKMGLFIGLVYIVCNPRAMERVEGFLKSIFHQLQDVMPHILSFIAEASKLAKDNQAQANIHLENALKDLECELGRLDQTCRPG